MPRVLLIAAAVLPFALAAAGAAHVADATGRRVGALLSRGASVVTVAPASRGARGEGPAVDPSPLEAHDGSDQRPAASLPARPRAAAGRPRGKAPAAGIRVSAATVLKLANSGVRPQGTPVPARGARPAGLLLSGVGGLGVGLRDGDVLTHAAGRPALSAGEVVSLVIASRGRRVPLISGRVWRDGQSFHLVVEQPYLAPRGERPGEDSTQTAAEAATARDGDEAASTG